MNPIPRQWGVRLAVLAALLLALTALVASTAGARQSALDTSEHKQFVLQNRSTQRSAKLIALQIISCWRKGVSGVEFVVADKLECGPV